MIAFIEAKVRIMDKIYIEAEFDEQVLECPSCNWKGSGSDTIIIDLYGISEVKEIHCPECDSYLAGVRSRSDNPPA